MVRAGRRVVVAAIGDTVERTGVATTSTDQRSGHARRGPLIAGGAERSEHARRGPLIAWLATLAGAIALLLLLGDGQLATPALTEPGAWGDWLADREPVVAAAGILRLLVLAVAWYLLGITTVSLVAHVARAARLVRIADALSVPIVRRVVQQAVGATLAGAVLSTSVAAPAPAPSLLAAGDTMAAEAPGDPLAMHALDDAGGDVLAMTAEPAGADVVTMAHLDDAPPRPSAGTHEVRPGDHLWSIAEDTLAAAWGRPPTDDEVEPYWRAVVEANRDVLATPDDPDLIFPGQVVTVPPPPAPGGST